jgi:hypothetical protein
MLQLLLGIDPNHTHKEWITMFLNPELENSAIEPPPEVENNENWNPDALRAIR